MTTPRLVVLLLAASFVSAAIAAPQKSDSKDETSNIIPLESEAKTSSPAPATLSPSTTSSTSSKPEVKAPARPLATGFSRFISDVFQIPISVLRAVNNLLTNPFNRDTASTAKKTGQ